ncbi:HEPN domain-containing protein [bacterium]|nr:HEPN domain-containing protein [FCB group bacterium]MBL7191511.1 HEPN domain-containing protein [bacterium]
MAPLSKDPESWIKQADYDLKVAESNYRNGFRFYAVFFCHLAIEKALKGLYFKKLNEIPPNTHSHFYLMRKIGIEPPESLDDFITDLQESHIATRYPEDFQKLQAEFTEAITNEIIEKSKDTLKWIKTML